MSCGSCSLETLSSKMGLNRITVDRIVQVSHYELYDMAFIGFQEESESIL